MNSKQLKLLDKLNELVLKCTDCDLCDNGRCGFYFTSKSKYVIIGEAPGREETYHREPFIGKAGTILWDNARECGLSKEEFGIINTVQCRPVVGNRNGKPQVHQQQQCRKWVRKFMKIMNPDYVLLLGRYSIAYVTRMDMSVLKMNGTFGYNTFDDGVKRTYLLSIHPSYCQYNKNGIELLRKSLSTFKTIASE